MKKRIPQTNIFLLFAISYFSCSTPTKEKNMEENEKTDTSQTLSSRANQFYESKMYLEAKKCYDSLLLQDSTNGQYYFRRAFLKSKLSQDDLSIDSDYLNSIKYNYKNKASAYLNLGLNHRFKAVFRSPTDKDKLTQYDTAILFYIKCLEIEPTREDALKQKREVENEISLIKRFPRN